MIIKENPVTNKNLRPVISTKTRETIVIPMLTTLTANVASWADLLSMEALWKIVVE